MHGWRLKREARLWHGAESVLVYGSLTDQAIMGYCIITDHGNGNYSRTIAPLFPTFEAAHRESGHVKGRTFVAEPSLKAVERCQRAAVAENPTHPNYSLAHCMNVH